MIIIIAEICTSSKCCSIELPPPLLSQCKSRVRWKVECQRLKQALTFGPQGGGSFSFVFVQAFNTTKGKSLKKCESESPAYWDNVKVMGQLWPIWQKQGCCFAFRLAQALEWLVYKVFESVKFVTRQCRLCWLQTRTSHAWRQTHTRQSMEVLCKN